MVTAVVPSDRGFVAVGSSGAAAETASAWSTLDGVSWVAEDVPSRGTSPRVLLPWEDRFLAFGGGLSDRCAHPGELDTWVRRPDRTWLEAPFSQEFCAGGTLTPIVLGSHAWIIGNGFGEVPTALDSPDGLTWTNRSKALGGVQILAADGDASGLWISDRGGDTATPEVRWSADGRSWSVVDMPLRLSDAPGLVTIDGHIHVVASTVAGPVFLRRAGASWDAVAMTGLGGAVPRLVRPAGAGLVAIAGQPDGPDALFVSRDGANWTPVPIPERAGPSAVLSDVAVGRGEVVLVGQVPPATPDALESGAIWVAPLSILEP
jgi:hypothetical protein